MAERIDIELTDKVAPSIETKIRGIASAARDADNSVSRLKANLASINLTAANRLQRALTQNTTAVQRNAIANQRLATEQQRTAAAAQRLATETQRTAAAQAAQAAAASGAAAAADRAALAALRLGAAQNAAAAGATTHGNALVRLGRNLAAVVGVGLSAGAIVAAGDAYTTLQNKLRIVVDTEEQLAEVTERLFDVAKRTRSPVLETAQAFARFDLSMKNLGASQEETLRLTETVNKALSLGGATVSEQASGLLQLSQAFNRGKIDGDEFRSMMELMPVAADAVAKQMKVTRGELLELAPKGKITVQVLRAAFASLAAEVDKKFANTIPTMAQGFQTLRNEAVKTFGEFNKAVGITEGIARSMQFLGENMKSVAVVAATAGAALLVAFGPTLASLLARAATAMWGFTAALAANPIGLLVVALAGLTAAFFAFQYDISTSADGVVKLGDTVRAFLEIITDTVGPVAKFFTDSWNTATTFVISQVRKLAPEFDITMGDILDYIKSGVNKFIGFFIAGFRSILIAWEKIPGLMSDIFTGKKSIMEAVGELAGNIKEEFKSAFDFDFIGASVDRVQKRARELALARKPPESKLRKAGPDLTKKPIDKDAVKRALALAKINEQLDKELARMSMLNPERAIQQRLDEIEIQLLGQKIKLTDKEREGIRKKIDLIEREKFVQAARDQILEDSIGPLRNWQSAQSAADQLLLLGRINLDQYNRALALAKKAYEEATQPLIGINRELDNQQRLLGFVGSEQVVQQQLQQHLNDLRQNAHTISEQERADLEARIRLIQRETDVNRALNQIYDETRGSQQELANRTLATQQAFERGFLSIEGYKQRLIALGVEAANLKLKLGEGTLNDAIIASAGKLVEGYEGILPGLSSTFGDFFASLQDGFANSIGRAVVYAEDLQTALSNVARSGLSELISGLIKLGIQYAVNAALGQTIAAATTATNSALAGATAAAWAPAAALASLASFGANSAPAMAGIAATMTLAQTLATAAGFLGGFEKGGFTGNGGRKDAAGIVHGQEFVVKADATARNRAALEAMNRGATFVRSNNSSAESKKGVTIQIENYGTSKTYETQQIDESTVRLIARDEARTAVDKHAPGVVAQQIGNPNSTVSKSLSRNTKTERKR